MYDAGYGMAFGASCAGCERGSGERVGWRLGVETEQLQKVFISEEQQYESREVIAHLNSTI